jgi:flagellar biosynthesis protein FlhB
MAERAQGRNEEPTPRRLAEARREGQVAVSGELSGSLALLGALVVLAAGGAAGAGQLAGYLRGTLATAAHGGSPGAALEAGLRQGLALLGLPLGVVAAVTLAGGLAQTGGLFTVAPLRWQARRAVPSARRLLDPALVGRVAWGLLQVAVLAGVAWLSVAPLLRPLAALAGASPGRILTALGRVTAAVGWRLGLAALAVGVADLLFRRARHRRALRMTRAEVERERKEHEGDPLHRAHRQRLHRELSGQPAPGDLRQSDFVVTGPSLAIALRYEPGGPSAPVVVARGTRLAAVRIEARARAVGAPIFFEPELAAALAPVEEGGQISPVLFEPVARILRVVLSGAAGAG